VRETEHFQPAINQCSGARCDDAPACAGVLKGCEEIAAAGDFDGVGAVLFRDLAFDIVDVCVSARYQLLFKLWAIYG
jgi:hypothetical protein